MAPPKTEEGAFDAHVTAGMCLLACGVTLMSWMGKDVSPLYLTDDAFFRQPWRMVTCVLTHANFREQGFLGFFHIIFNVMMIMRYGRFIEARYHGLLTGLFYFAVALGSGTLQFALSGGGIGLSGVGYGVFGFLWVASKRMPDFRDSLDYGAIVTWVGWFFFCIAATHFNVMHIANVAHGAGMGFGALIGLAASARSSTTKTALGVATIALIGASIMLGAHAELVPQALRGAL